MRVGYTMQTGLSLFTTTYREMQRPCSKLCLQDQYQCNLFVNLPRSCTPSKTLVQPFLPDLGMGETPSNFRKMKGSFGRIS